MAITNVYFQPKIWSSGYNPIIWSVGSDKNTQTDMKYVFDVYVNAATGASVYTYRIKQRPNPAGVGMIDVSSLVQPYLDLTNYNPELTTLNYNSSTINFATVHVKVGEEYLSNGAMTVFTGYGPTGSPGYFLSPYGATGNFVRTIPSALTFNEQMAILGDFTYNPFWDQYIMDGNGKFLSLDPGNRSVRFNDRHTLTLLNRWDALPAYGSFASSILGIRVVTYTSAGAVLGSNQYDNTTPNGGGPQANSIYTSTTENRLTDILAFRCGPKDLNFTNPAIAYYTVTAFVKLAATSDPTYTYTASETVRFNLDTECEDLYKNVRLSWLNSLGGRDYYNFKMFYEKTTTSKQEVYNQFDLNWSTTQPITKATVASSVYNRGGDKIFNKTVDTKFTIQSDWLTQAYVDYLSGIPESSSVWAYIGDDSNIPYTLVIENVDYTYKNVKQTKMVQATFTCRYTKNQIKQNL